MTRTSTLSPQETSDIHPLTPLLYSNAHEGAIPRIHRGRRLLWQMPRFAIVGLMNATLDLLVLNGLLWLFPTTITSSVLLYTIIAYSVGAANSFFLNKYWTFQHRQRTNSKELLRFTMTVLLGLGWSMLCIWLASIIAHPFITNTTIWTNLSKVVALGSAAFLSFLAMRLWIFVKPSPMRPS